MRLTLFISTLLISINLLLLQPEAFAEAFHLRSGETINGDIQRESESFYVVKTPDGSNTVVLKSKIAKDEPQAEAKAEEEPIVQTIPNPTAVKKTQSVTPKVHRWYDDERGYKLALKEQKTTYEPFVLYFYTNWCPYCKKFQSDLLSSPKIEKALKPVLKVQVDGDIEKKLEEKFHVRGYPYFVVVSKSGGYQQIDTHADENEFLKQCRQAGLKLS